MTKTPAAAEATTSAQSNAQSTHKAAQREAASAEHRVGAGFSVRFTYSPPHLVSAEWSPRVPLRREMKRIHARYCAALAQFARKLADTTNARGCNAN
ncbi:hypothetical protein SDC9_111004 [bioreactor metagenome]|uniref:Uncharacterized protein n=1 Tax=bioreactor metagenome TaxID=1076179 RepID=A0A645BGC7_9ZZZZ